MKVTISDLAVRLGVEYAAAQGLLKFLQKRGIAKETKDVVRLPGARGKGSAVWEVPEQVTLDLTGQMAAANLVPGESR